MVTNLYLIRHGETDWNREGRFQGQTDIPLNEKGLWQASQLHKWFKEIEIDQIFSSDLGRAYQTATMLASKRNLQVETFKQLRERSLGKLEGKYAEEFKNHYGSAYFNILENNPEWEVEPYPNLQERMYNQIMALIEEHKGKHLIVVSHGAALNAFLSRVSQGQFGTGKTRLDNTSVTHIKTTGDRWQIVCLNDTSHLASDEDQVGQVS